MSELLQHASELTHRMRSHCTRRQCAFTTKQSQRRHRCSHSIARAVSTPPVFEPPTFLAETTVDDNQSTRSGSTELRFVTEQASKADPEQPSIYSYLARLDAAVDKPDVCIVGCGPAGLALAAELAALGVSVALVGKDAPFVNTYGVWLDEFRELCLEHTLEVVWNNTIAYCGSDKPVNIGRAYGRVSRPRLRDHLLRRCAQHGVKYLAAEVINITHNQVDGTSRVLCKDESIIQCRLTTLAAGAAAGKFLQYEDSAPAVAAQTAYGIEAEVDGYDAAYPSDAMLFMDYRRHHSGLWTESGIKSKAGAHPNGDGVWGSSAEVPSFLYAMPLANGRVFLEETCLVGRPAMPFNTLKRRLHRRLDALGIRVKKVHEEEWSYIPVGGPLPQRNQLVTAFGASANLVHPATGYSVTRSLREAPAFAAAIKSALDAQLPLSETSQRVWSALWSAEKCRQAAFQVFGMELLASLNLAAIHAFFDTFFRLPSFLWRGYLSSQLSSAQLLVFALSTFAIAPPSIQYKLIAHLFTDPSGQYLVKTYAGAHLEQPQANSSLGTAEAV